MKKSIWIVATLLCATLAQALPQENGQAEGASSPKMRQSEASKLVDRLETTEEQKQEIAAIRKQIIEENTPFLQLMEKTLNELRAARQANELEKMEQLRQTVLSQREDLKKIQDDELQRIMGILNREQHAQFEEWKAAREHRDAPKSGE
jgi:Spy/CpxP family protein refolding chaperone